MSQIVYPAKVEDFDPEWLDSQEWTALADFCQGELLAWSDLRKMELESGKDDAVTARVIEDFRKRVRAYKTFAAEAEARQTEFENERRKPLTAPQQRMLTAAREGRLFQDALGRYFVIENGHPTRAPWKPVENLLDRIMIRWEPDGPHQMKAVVND